MSDQKEKISLALGRIPSGLFIVTFHNNDLNEQDGMLMSWVQQASFEPPIVGFAIKKGRRALELIQKAGHFVVNVMGKQNAKIIGSFYKGVGAAKFENLNTQPAANSENLILSDAVSYLECKVKSIAESGGDHVIVFGEVLSGDLLNTEQNEPSFHVRKNGFDY